MLNEINKSILNWDMQTVRKQYEMLIKISPQYIPLYIKFLYQCGLLEDVLSLSSKEVDISLITTANYDDFINCLIKLVNDKIENITTINYPFIENEILEIYKLNYIIKEKKVSVDLGTKIIETIFYKQTNQKSISRIYAYTILFNYFKEQSEWKYFVNIRTLSIWMNEYLYNTNGSNKYTKILIEILNKHYNCFSLSLSKSDKPKVAIIVAGILRGFYQMNIHAIVNYLAKPLNADIFLFSWDEFATWHGLPNLANFSMRHFPEIKPLFPFDGAKLKNTFPNTYKKLNKEHYEKLDKHYFDQWPEFVSIMLENQSNFENTIVHQINNKIYNRSNFESDEFKTLSSNLLKMYYANHKAKELIIEHENKNNFKYDYIIRIRPDTFPRNIDLADLSKLRENEIACHSWSAGIDDKVYYGRRNEMMKYLSLYEYGKKDDFNFHINAFSKPFFVESCHRTQLDWLLANNLVLRSSDLLNSFMQSYNNIFHISYFPDISETLKEDIKIIKQNKSISKYELDFCLRCFDRYKRSISQKRELLNNNFYETMQYYAKHAKSIVDIELSKEEGQLSLKPKVEILQYNSQQIINTAKSRIHNQLSYKLGQAMIENSKSIWGYIRMPYVLSYIKDMHKKEQIAYNEKIKANPNLKLPPLESYPDYKEALKEKECLTYKLGEAMIEASKNWYKGGYVKFIFKAIRLKEKYMKK